MSTSVLGRVPGPFRVYVGLISTGYLDPLAIQNAIWDGVVFCGLASTLEKTSKIVLRPDLGIADRKIARYGYTHPEILSSSFKAIRRANPGVTADCWVDAAKGFSPYRMMKRASGGSQNYLVRGYYELQNQYGASVSLQATEDGPQTCYRLSGRVNSTEMGIMAREDFAAEPFTVYIPKLKTSAIAQGIAGAVWLPAKESDTPTAENAVSWLEICNPSLVIGDGIVAGIGGGAHSQRAQELGVILVSNNALAHDWVAAQIFHQDPMATNGSHLKLARDMGWGPELFYQIELGGAGPDGIKLLQQKSRHWDFGAATMEEFPAKFNRENAGIRFDWQTQTEGELVYSAQVLEKLHLAYDFPQNRHSMSKWPRVEVVTRAMSHFPKARRVLLVGEAASQSWKKLTSTLRKRSSVPSLFSRDASLSFERATLKNGKTVRAAILLPKTKKVDPFGALNTALWGLSRGRIKTEYKRWYWPLERILFYPFYRLRILKFAASDKVVLTSRLKHCLWWSLGKSFRSAPSDLAGSRSSRSFSQRLD